MIIKITKTKQNTKKIFVPCVVKMSDGCIYDNDFDSKNQRDKLGESRMIIFLEFSIFFYFLPKIISPKM